MTATILYLPTQTDRLADRLADTLAALDGVIDRLGFCHSCGLRAEAHGVALGDGGANHLVKCATTWARRSKP